VKHILTATISMLKRTISYYEQSDRDVIYYMQTDILTYMNDIYLNMFLNKIHIQLYSKWVHNKKSREV
jgi:hypothetical protein